MKSSVEHYIAYTFVIVDKQENVYSFIVKSQNNKDRTLNGAWGLVNVHYLPVFGPVCTILSVSTSEFWRSL